ncbi:uncharacterized protein LOC126846753 [Adelges cooleyi]|uniref:uncharacterized protein LOC126846753 n=1 Tax=Adelges cooleyi TaxID=133065 RepID=UPI00218046BA|nr:uncharacterized protein LOC126846753 [Adelges cooleyi]
MYHNLLVSIVIAAVAVTRVQHGFRVRAMPEPLTPDQLDLVDGVYRQQYWNNDLWFTSVKDEGDWTAVDVLCNRRSTIEGWKQLHSMPVMMGCKYGVKFHWFLSLALIAIGECSELSRKQDGNTGHCWYKLVQGLQEGSYTMLEVKSALSYIHSTIGDDIDSDVFYQIVSTVRDSINQHSVSECTVSLPKCLGYMQLMTDHTVNLGIFLSSNCRPEYPRLNMNELSNFSERRIPRAHIYRLYVIEMKAYMEDVSAHLFDMGFRIEDGLGNL